MGKRLADKMPDGGTYRDCPIHEVYSKAGQRFLNLPAPGAASWEPYAPEVYKRGETLHPRDAGKAIGLNDEIFNVLDADTWAGGCRSRGGMLS